MPFPKLIDQIDDLFDQLIRQPWSRPAPAAKEAAGDENVLELAVPVADCERGHMRVVVEGRRLDVILRRRGSAAAQETHELRQSFALPEGADVSRLEARFEGDFLRLRVGLHRTRRTAR